MLNILVIFPCLVVTSAGIVIDIVSVQSLLGPFCCVLGKDTLWHFLLIDGFSKKL